MFLSKKIFVFGLALGLLFIASRAEAGLINGNFENNFNNWTSLGGNSAVVSGTINGFNATSGNKYAFLSSGPGALSVPIHDFVLNSTTGIPTDYVSTTFSNATEGGSLYQTFTLGAGNDGINFDWVFVTDEFANDPLYNDFAFALLYDNTQGLVAGSAVLDTFSGLVGGGPNFARELDGGWQTVKFGGLVEGNSYTLLFGVFDVVDGAVDSGLLIDNIVTKQIPEPSAALSVILAGLVATGLRRRSRKS